MHWQLNYYALALLISALTSGAIAVYAWYRRPATCATSLMLIMFGAAEWSLGYAVGIGLGDLRARIFWAKMQHLGIAIVPLMMLIFILQYTGHEKWLTRRNLTLLAIVPVIGLLLAWTNEAHKLIWSNMRLTIHQSIYILNLEYGPFFWVYVTYNYLLLLLGTFLLLRTQLLSSYLQRRQSPVILAGMLLPWGGNFLYLTGWNPFPYLDLTPFCYSLTGLVFAWGLFRYRLLDIIPIARDKVVEHMNDGVIVLDARVRIVDINPAIQKLIGRPLTDIIGRSIDQILPEYPDLITRYRNGLEARTQITLNDGKSLSYYDLYISPLYSRRRKLIGHLLVFHNITESKRIEAALRQAKETAEEAQRIAEEAQIAAEAASKAKSIFLANISHELRTPLNAILGFAQLITHSLTLSQKDRENLSIISRSGEHLLTLINQVLDLSKIEAGKITLNETDFNLFRLLHDVVDLFRFRARGKGLYLIFDRADNVPQYVRTDEVKLRQILVNLLSNAIKFTEEGKISLRVYEFNELDEFNEFRELSNLDNSTTQQFNNSTTLRFKVEDTGPGIAPEEMDKLFEAFSQTRTGRQAQEGTGLGLSISKKFVQLMGGDITVRSNIGYGTTFMFDIRCKIIDSTDNHQSLRPDSEQLSIVNRVVGLESNQPRYRILIVDDKADNRKLFVEHLSRLAPSKGLRQDSGQSFSTSLRTGFELREASNGQETIKIWNEWQPHLIWMGFWEPFMEGYEAIQTIRKLETGNSKIETRTVIIAVIANFFGEERDIELFKGCDDLLHKPFREAEIFELMHKHLGVRYVYKEDEKPRLQCPTFNVKDVLTPATLATLPTKLRTELQHAVEEINLDMALSLIEQIHQQNASLADDLVELVKNYRFDILQKLFEKLE
jgi:PAS domain S-box-containing protein